MMISLFISTCALIYALQTYCTLTKIQKNQDIELKRLYDSEIPISEIIRAIEGVVFNYMRGDKNDFT